MLPIPYSYEEIITILLTNCKFVAKSSTDEMLIAWDMSVAAESAREAEKQRSCGKVHHISMRLMFSQIAIVYRMKLIVIVSR